MTDYKYINSDIPDNKKITLLELAESSNTYSEDKPLVLEDLIYGTIASTSEKEEFVRLNETEIKSIINLLKNVEIDKVNRRTLGAPGKAIYMLNLTNNGSSAHYDSAIFIMIRKDEDLNRVVLSPAFDDFIYETDDMAFYSEIVKYVENSLSEE